jgi:hypothetical protein
LSSALPSPNVHTHPFVFSRDDVAVNVTEVSVATDAGNPVNVTTGVGRAEVSATVTFAVTVALPAAVETVNDTGNRLADPPNAWLGFWVVTFPDSSPKFHSK